MSEEEIVRDICKGGRTMERALRSLYDSTAQHMLRFFVYQGVSGDDAKDILQETFVKVVRYAGSYKGDGAARSWIWQIARNCLTDHQRAAGRGAEYFVTVNDDEWDDISRNTPGPSTADPPGQTADECVTQGMETFANQMPERAYALTLQMEGSSLAEIASCLGRTVAATKQYLSQCKKKLQPFVAHCAELLVS